MGELAAAPIWAVVCDGRPWGGTDPTAAWYAFTANRRGEHPATHLAPFRGWMHADGYSVLSELCRRGTIQDAARPAHIRRKVVDAFRSQGPEVAEGAICRIAGLHDASPTKRSRGSTA